MSGLDAHLVLRRHWLDLDVQLTVPQASVTALLGPNGAGKSTALRLISGLESLDAGHIRVADQTWAQSGLHLPIWERNVGLLFQDQRLLQHLNVLDNVAFGLRARGVRARAARSRAQDLLAEHGLSQFASKGVHRLSGGQAQQVALARALITEPKLLLMDEPLSALDTRVRASLRRRLGERLHQAGVPVVLVTHDPLDALMLADQVAVLESGRIRQQGTPAEVAEQPGSDFAASMLGWNVWGAQLQPDGTAVLEHGGQLHLNGASAARSTSAPLEPGSVPESVLASVLVSVPPNAITVHAQDPALSGVAAQASARNYWQATITSLERIGDRVRIGTQGPPHAIIDVTAASVRELNLGIADTIWLSVKATAIEVTSLHPESRSSR